VTVHDVGRRPVGVFDSGVGGLSVLREIRTQLPMEALVYVADSGFAPYGNRSAGYIAARSYAIADFLVERHVKAIVIACNTATVAIAATLRSHVRIPVIAIEPAVKPAAAQSHTGVIGVLATRQTLASDRFSHLIGAHAAGVEVVSEACPDLVDLVEHGETRGPEVDAAVRAHVDALLGRGADVIVLGCTHFYFLRSVIQAAAGSSTVVIEPAHAVAAQLRRRLGAAGALEVSAPDAPVSVYSSGDLAQGTAVIARLWGSAFDLAALPQEYCVAPDR
jgi:glutamate racemase